MAQKNQMIEQIILDMYRKGEIKGVKRNGIGYEIHNISSLKNLVAKEFNLPVKPNQEDRYLKTYSKNVKHYMLSRLYSKMQQSEAIESMISGISMSIMANLPQLEEGRNNRNFSNNLQDRLTTLKLSLDGEIIRPNILCHYINCECISCKTNSDQIMQDIIRIDLNNRGLIEDPEIEKVKLRVKLENAIDEFSANNAISNDLLEEAEAQGLKEYALQYMIDNDLKLDITEDIKSSLAVEYCIEHNIKIKNIDPLKYAIDNGKLIDGEEAFIYAIRNNRTIEGKSAIEYAIANLKTSNGNTPLILAAAKGKSDIVTALIEAGANIEEKDQYGNTALMRAAQNGKDDVVKALIEAGANIEEKDQYGNTTLILAAKEGKSDIVLSLISYRANIKHVNNQGSTALSWASEKCDTKAIEALIKHGANVNHLNNGSTALIWAAIQGKTDAVRALINAGANVNHVTSTGSTALIWAIRHDKTDVALHLIEVGANLNFVDKTGRNALAWAAKKGNLRVVETLIEHGVNIKIKEDKSLAASDSIIDIKIKKNIKFYPLLISIRSKEEIEDQDIKILRENFQYLSDYTKEQFIKTCRSELLKQLAQDIKNNQALDIKNNQNLFQNTKTAIESKNYDELKRILTASTKLTPQHKVELLEKACINRDIESAKLLLEVRADYTKLNFAKIDVGMIKFLKSYGIKIKSKSLEENTILEKINSFQTNALKDIFNNIDPNKYKDVINKALQNSNISKEDKTKLVIFLCKKGFNPQNFSNKDHFNLVTEIIEAISVISNPNNIKKTIKIIDEVISKTAASDKVDNEKIFRKMQNAELIPRDVSAEKKASIIKKISKITVNYNHQERSHNILKRAVRSLLHFVGIKYVGKKEVGSLLAKINLPPSKKDKTGSIRS